MHSTWFLLRWAWSAVVIAYCVLSVVADRQLRGEAKRRSRNLSIAIFVLVVLRFVVQRTVGGQVYRLTVMIVGLAAGIAALVVTQMLIRQKPGEDEAVGLDDDKDRIQSLKLS